MGPEALWSIEFIDNKKHHGGGIAVFYRNRVLGGNSSFTYIGRYSLNKGEITFDVDVKRFNDDQPGIYKDEFRITAKGKYDDLDFIITGSPDNDESIILAIQCIRQGEIPP